MHARLHHGFAQVGRDHIRPTGQRSELRVRAVSLQDLVARQNQLPYQVHHAIEEVDVNPKRRIGSVRLRRVLQVRGFAGQSRFLLRGQQIHDARVQIGALWLADRCKGQQTLNHRVVAAQSFVAVSLDRVQDGTQAILQIKQCTDDLGVYDQLPVAQHAEQVFTGMRERLQAGRSQEIQLCP